MRFLHVARDGTRTHDLLITNQLRYQLRHSSGYSVVRMRAVFRALYDYTLLCRIFQVIFALFSSYGEFLLLKTGDSRVFGHDKTEGSPPYLTAQRAAPFGGDVICPVRNSAAFSEIFSQFLVGKMLSRYNFLAWIPDDRQGVGQKANETAAEKESGLMAPRKEVSEKLRHYREACVLSQRQVADALNIERSTYTKYETGDTEPNLYTLVRIAAIFGVDPSQLLPVCDDQETVALRAKKRSNNALAALPKEERGLLAVFRTLSKEEKRQALEWIGNLSKKHT